MLSWLWVCASAEDVFSLLQLDAKSREWLVFSSQANYQSLAKLAAGNPRLARFKVRSCVYHSSFSNVSILHVIESLYCGSRGGMKVKMITNYIGHARFFLHSFQVIIHKSLYHSKNT
jgi:hypothetical protein